MLASRKYLKPDTDMILDGDIDGRFLFNTNNCIGKGNFGNIYLARNLHTYEVVAIKTEPISSLQLHKESKAYTRLGVMMRNHNIQGLPEIYYISNIGLECIAMAMEMLGPTLNELLSRCGNKFSLKTVLMIAMQMISRIEHIHNCKMIHRDIKPENILFGLPMQTFPYKPSTEKTVYLIDFGMAKLYVKSETDEHIPFTDDADIVGTYLFMSANCHLHIEQSRRDDLESFGYVILFLINGTLPWWKYLKEQNINKCGEMKSEIKTKDLCDGLPEEFVKYFDYVKQLEFSEKPNYEMLYNIFESAYVSHKFLDDSLFDWSNLSS